MTLVVIFAGVFRILLGLLFIAAAWFKYRRTRSVRRFVERYHLLPPLGVKIAAVLLAPVELATGVLVVLSLWVPVHMLAAVMASGLLLLFTAAVGSALARGIVVPCGCGPLVGDHVITPITIARNLLLLALLVVDFALVR